MKIIEFYNKMVNKFICISNRLSQLLKGAVVVTLCQNEADVKCQMDIDSSISLTEQMLFGYRHYAHRKCPTSLYFCLISSEGRTNCSFIWLILSQTQKTEFRRVKHGIA